MKVLDSFVMKNYKRSETRLIISRIHHSNLYGINAQGPSSAPGRKSLEWPRPRFRVTNAAARLWENLSVHVQITRRYVHTRCDLK